MKILYLPNSYSQQRQHEKKANIYPVRMAMEAEWYRQQRHEVQWGLPKDRILSPWKDTQEAYDKLYIEGNGFDKIISKPENLPFLDLPKPDRIFTNAKSYTSGNYKYLPGTHIQAADGCWWGKCSFCVENTKEYVVRPVEYVIEEIEECRSLGFKEIFDDSGTFPVGAWLDSFCQKMKGNTTPLGCNMRTVNIDYRAMKEAGFRMVLFGIESANDYTLTKINKGVTSKDIVKYIIQAHSAGLEPHVCAIVGFPWETDSMAEKTLKLVHWLLRKGYAKTAQMSLYSPDGNENQHHLVNKLYDVKYSPEFWFNQLRDIKNKDDIKYLWRKIKAGLNK